MTNTSAHEYPALCCAIAKKAGALIMGYFTGSYRTTHKNDASPVTDADLAANAMIVSALQQMTPHIPIIAEEDIALDTATHSRFWLVDPLDGTRSFVRGEPEFTVNIGLIENGIPTLGIIYAPAWGALYYGGIGIGAHRSLGGGAFEPIHCRIPPEDGLVIARSRSKPSAQALAYLESTKVKEAISCSSSIKLCYVAEGRADRYPRFGRTMEWDIAAGQAILEAAGGAVETLDGKPLGYGKPGLGNPAFIARGKL